MERLRPQGLSHGPIETPDRNLWEKRMTDLLYLAGGVAVLLLFAAYPLLLKRA